MQTRGIDFRTLTLQDALDLAILVEQEAQQRYAWFTQEVGGRYPGDAADMFRLMASAEAKHAAKLIERRRALFGSAPRRISIDQLDDVEAPDRGAPRVFMSARQAMQVALEAEENAHDFYDDALKEVRDPEVHKLFEELREEEVHHQQMVTERMQHLPPGPDLEEDEVDEPGTDPGN
jgi:erythrin-vacuolar iron transport family protein